MAHVTTKSKTEDEAASSADAGRTEVETEDPETEDDEHSGVTLDALADRVDRLSETVRAFIKGGAGGSKSKASEAEDVAAQVRDEVGKIRTAEKARESREARVQALEEKVQAIVEAPPREYRRVTRVLWGEDGDG